MAFNIEEEKFLEVEDIRSEFCLEDQGKIVIANYDDVLTPKTVKQREILMREFSKQEEFYNMVIEISNEMLEMRRRTISKERSESAALYILQELPLFLDGVMKIGNDVIYTAILYPGLGKLDELVIKIRNNDKFMYLKETLNIKNSVGIVDVE